MQLGHRDLILGIQMSLENAHALGIAVQAHAPPPAPPSPAPPRAHAAFDADARMDADADAADARPAPAPAPSAVAPAPAATPAEAMALLFSSIGGGAGAAGAAPAAGGAGAAAPAAGGAAAAPADTPSPARLLLAAGGPDERGAHDDAHTHARSGAASDALAPLTPHGACLGCALAKLAAVDALLLGAVEFWTSMELLIDYVMTRKEAAETHLASTSVHAARRAVEKFKDFSTFWAAFARLCGQYGEMLDSEDGGLGGMFAWLSVSAAEEPRRAAAAVRGLLGGP